MRRSLLALLVSLVVGGSVPAQAARTGSGTTADTLTTTTMPVTVPPITVSMWVNVASLAAAQTLLYIGDSTVNTDYLEISIQTSGAARVTAASLASGASSATTANTLTTGGWHHILAQWSTTVSRTVILDAGTPAAAAVARTPSSPNVLCLLDQDGLVPGAPSSATIQNVAIWDAVQAGIGYSTSAMAVALYSGLDPRTIRGGAHLVRFWPLVGYQSPELDVIAGAGLTINGTVSAASSRPIRGGNR